MKSRKSGKASRPINEKYFISELLLGGNGSEEDGTMKIDIDGPTESELIDLNNRIVERLRFLKQKQAHEQMLKFKIGDRVTFHPEGLPPVVGMLTRYNRKSVTVITDDGQH
jgi:hypothetical protein